MQPILAIHKVQRNADPYHYEKYGTDTRRLADGTFWEIGFRRGALHMVPGNSYGGVQNSDSAS